MDDKPSGENRTQIKVGVVSNNHQLFRRYEDEYDDLRVDGRGHVMAGSPFYDAARPEAAPYRLCRGRALPVVASII